MLDPLLDLLQNGSTKPRLRATCEQSTGSTPRPCSRSCSPTFRRPCSSPDEPAPTQRIWRFAKGRLRTHDDVADQ